jgi:predicted nucleotidyltransferase
MTAADATSATVAAVLESFTTAARAAFGADLRSIVLFGSGAEDRLRATSDVNVIVVLERFRFRAADALREPLRTAHAAIKLEPMFLLADEIPVAVEAFADKFADVARRRRVLFGDDPFAGIAPARTAEIARLRQTLLNLELRLRARYVLQSLREEQATLVIADVAGPLRACSATLLDLEGSPAPSAREALARILGEGSAAGAPDLAATLSTAREQRTLSPGVAVPALQALIGVAGRLRARAERLR